MTEKLLYILIGYLPFQVALNPYFDIDLMSGRVLILALFFYWLWTVRRSPKGQILKLFSFQGAALLIFLFFAFVSLFFAKEIGWGLRKILVFCSVFPLYFLTARIINNREKIKKTFKIMVFGGFFMSIIGIFQFLAQFIFIPGQVTNFWVKWIAPVFYGRAFGWLVSTTPSWLMEIGDRFYIRAISLFPDPHNFAIYLGLIIPLSLSLLIFTEENRKLLFAANCFLFIALLLTFSRGGYFAMLATLMFFGFIFLVRSNMFDFFKKRRILLFIVYCLLFIIFLIPITPVSHCFYSAFDFSRHSNIERARVWEEAFNSVSSHPWFGVGIGNFPKVVDPWAKYLSPINAHSVYLDIAAEMGVFTLYVWLILFAGTIFGLVRKMRIFAEMGANFYEYKVISLGTAGSLIWFSFHALVETSIYNPTILSLLMVFLGISTNLLNSKFKPQN